MFSTRQVKFLYNSARGFDCVLSIGMTFPHIALVQKENQLCLLRFSTHPQQGSFHGMFASWTCFCGFDASQKKKEKKRKKMFFCLYYVSASLFLSVSQFSLLCGPFRLVSFIYFLHLCKAQYYSFVTVV